MFSFSFRPRVLCLYLAEPLVLVYYFFFLVTFFLVRGYKVEDGNSGRDVSKEPDSKGSVRSEVLWQTYNLVRFMVKIATLTEVGLRRELPFMEVPFYITFKFSDTAFVNASRLPTFDVVLHSKK